MSDLFCPHIMLHSLIAQHNNETIFMFIKEIVIIRFRPSKKFSYLVGYKLKAPLSVSPDRLLPFHKSILWNQ